MLWDDNYLAHHGIEGQHWHVRRFQNPDGSYTEEGKRRYGIGENENNVQPSEKDSNAENKNSNNLKKILGITAGVGLAALTGVFAYKVGKQWLSNLKTEMLQQAVNKSSEYTWNGFLPAMRANLKEVSAAKMAKDPLEKSLHAAEARRMYAVSMAARKGRDHYDKIIRDATELGALKNYLKNKGKIVI